MMRFVDVFVYVFVVSFAFFTHDVNALGLQRAAHSTDCKAEAQVRLVTESIKVKQRIKRQTERYVEDELKKSDGRHVRAIVTVENDQAVTDEFDSTLQLEQFTDQRYFSDGQNAYHRLLTKVSSRYQDLLLLYGDNVAAVTVDFHNILHGVAPQNWARHFRKELTQFVEPSGKEKGAVKDRSWNVSMPDGKQREIDSDDCVFVFPFVRRRHPDAGQRLPELNDMLRELIEQDRRLAKEGKKGSTFSQRIIAIIIEEDESSGLAKQDTDDFYLTVALKHDLEKCGLQVVN